MVRAGALSIVAVLFAGANAASTGGHGAGHDAPEIEYPNMCDVGLMQSPILLHRCMTKPASKKNMYPVEREAITPSFAMESSTLELVQEKNHDGTYRGNALKITPTEKGTSTFGLTSHGVTKTYKVEYCLVHGGSEHQIHLDHGHGQYELEVQCVGMLDEEGAKQYGVLSALYGFGQRKDQITGEEKGETSSAFFEQFTGYPETSNGILANITNFGKKEEIDIDYNFLGGDIGLTRYWTYVGALTTAPCQENAQWIIMYDPVGVSRWQIQTMLDASVHGSAKHYSPANGRHPDGCPVAHAGATSNGVFGAFMIMLAAVLSRA